MSLTLILLKKTRYQAHLGNHLKGALVLALSAVAVGLVMLAAQPVYAWIGVTAAVLGVGVSVVNAVKAYRKTQAQADAQTPLLQAPVAERLVVAPAPVAPAPVINYGRLFSSRARNVVSLASVHAPMQRRFSV